MPNSSSHDQKRFLRTGYERRDNMKINVATDTPVAIYNPGFPVTGDTPLEKALDFISQNLEIFNLENDIHTSSSGELDFSLTFRHLSSSQIYPVWTTVRLQQLHDGAPVFEGYVTITINSDDLINMVMFEYKNGINIDPSKQSTKQTSDMISSNILSRYNDGGKNNIELNGNPILTIYQDEESGISQFAWYAKYTDPQNHIEYEVLVNDQDGKTLLRRDVITGKQMDTKKEKEIIVNKSPIPKSNSLRSKQTLSNTKFSETEITNTSVQKLIRKLHITLRSETVPMEKSESIQATITEIMNTVQIKSDRKLQGICISSLVQRLLNLVPFLPESNMQIISNPDLFVITDNIITSILDFGCPALQSITGNIFSPDPLSSSRSRYGDSGFLDDEDKDSAELNDQLFEKSVDADYFRGRYYLSGTYAQLVDNSSPFKGNFDQASPIFSFSREKDGFEAFNTYYHITKMLEYLIEDLGITIKPSRYVGPVKFDPHGADGEDNSHYSLVEETVVFGEGGVDDAEDADVIVHELGHLIHHWITGHPARLHTNQGLSEGFSDYLANSYSRPLGNWTTDDEEYYWVFKWDGHNEFWEGRTTNYTGIYPMDLVNQIHTDGQIWSTCNMKIWDAIGREKSDKAHILGLSAGSISSTQEDIANAVLTAAIDLGYSSSNITIMTSIYQSCGYVITV